MARILAFTPIVAVGLLGCAPMQTQQQFQAMLNQKSFAVRDECRKRRTEGQIKNWREFANCMNDGALAAAIEINYPYIDLIILSNAYRSALADKLDRGEITETDAQLAQAQVGAFITKEQQQRAVAAVQAASAQQQAAAASAQSMASMLGAFAAYQQSLAPPVTQQVVVEQMPPTHLNCMALGDGLITCR